MKKTRFPALVCCAVLLFGLTLTAMAAPAVSADVTKNFDLLRDITWVDKGGTTQFILDLQADGLHVTNNTADASLISITTDIDLNADHQYLAFKTTGYPTANSWNIGLTVKDSAGKTTDIKAQQSFKPAGWYGDADVAFDLLGAIDTYNADPANAGNQLDTASMKIVEVRWASAAPITTAYVINAFYLGTAAQGGGTEATPPAATTPAVTATTPAAASPTVAPTNTPSAAPTKTNPKSGDSTFPYVMLFGAALLLVAGAALAPKFMKNGQK